MLVRRIVSVVVAAAVLIVAVGCSSDESALAGERIAGSMAELFQEVLDDQDYDLSPLEREVVERAVVAGRIDPVDYEASHAQYVRCMEGNGFETSFRKTPEGYYINLGWVTEREDVSDIDVECMDGERMIEVLFAMQQGNPDLLSDQRLVAIQCLRRVGLVDSSYTVDDFDRDMNRDEIGGTDPIFSFDIYEDSANNCLYYAGYAFSIDEEVRR